MDETRENPEPSEARPGSQLDTPWEVLGAASREKADAYLEEQTILTRLQAKEIAHELAHELKLRHWSLVVHHASDVMKVTFELAVAFVALVVIAVIATAIWAAAHDDSLVIEAFKVPPDMARKGLDGDVVASELLDQLRRMQIGTQTMRAPGTYASDWANDIRVEIPETGVSIGEAYRYLAGWLGHRTFIAGEIYDTDRGIALTARVGNNPGVHFEGAENGLGALMQKAAEAIYRQTQPYRYAVYLVSTNRGESAEYEDVLRDLALEGPPTERPWAYALWAFTPLDAGDDVAAALDRIRTAVRLAPDLPDTLDTLADIEALAGHDEQELRALVATKTSLTGSRADTIVPRAARTTKIEVDAAIAEETGDFGEAVRQYRELEGEEDFEGSHWVGVRMGAADAAFAHDIEGSRELLGRLGDEEMASLMLADFGWQLPNLQFPQFAALAAHGDWRAARKDLEKALSVPAARQTRLMQNFRRQIWPWLALTEAKTGDATAARKLIGTTPLDCYLCLRVRGLIDVADGNPVGAASWFARALMVAPSIPFAYSDWGEMLLHEGRYDDAISKFLEANLKGPHFADPLETWGEALMLKNRSDLALAKFEEASKYAPNWGRLHLKWGEALYYAGKRDEAKAQFSAASRLDLSSADAATLSKWMKHIG
jgi:tetratricopeptide (TPR) repeat protein